MIIPTVHAVVMSVAYVARRALRRGFGSRNASFPTVLRFFKRRQTHKGVSP